MNCDKCSEGKGESLDIMRKNKVGLEFILRNGKVSEKETFELRPEGVPKRWMFKSLWGPWLMWLG